METPLAVIVPTVGRSRELLPLLEQILEQAAPGDEIAVVDQSEAPDRQRLLQWAEARGDGRLAVHALERRSLPYARNVGIARTRSPVLVFFDDDVVLAPGCLSAHREAYADPAVGGAVGRIVERRLRPNARRTTNRVGRSGRIHTRLDGEQPQDIETLKGANMSLRRAALEQLPPLPDGTGPFDEGYGGTALLEDADLSVRLAALGWRLRFVPSASLEHLHVPTGGVRTGAPDAQWWRFRNTGYFAARHRGPWATLPLGAAFLLLALKDAGQRRQPGRLPSLVGALAAGWRAGFSGRAARR